jgi:hypothetical protein
MTAPSGLQEGRWTDQELGDSTRFAFVFNPAHNHVRTFLDAPFPSRRARGRPSPDSRARMALVGQELLSSGQATSAVSFSPMAGRPNAVSCRIATTSTANWPACTCWESALRRMRLIPSAGMPGAASHFTMAASITMAARYCGPFNIHSLGGIFATGANRVACESTGSKIPKQPHTLTVLSASISPGSFRLTRPTSGA